MTYEEKGHGYNVTRQPGSCLIFGSSSWKQQRQMPGAQLRIFLLYPAGTVMDRPCREQSSASKKQSSGQLRRLVSVMKSAKRLRRRWMHWTICMTGTSCTANTSTSRVGTPSSATLTFPKVQCWRTIGRQSRAYK